MGLEIEFEYADTADGTWSPPQDARVPRDWLRPGRGRSLPIDNPLIVQLGIAFAALVLGAASMAGFLAGRTAAHDRTVTLLHLAPAQALTIPVLPPPPRYYQDPDQLLATPWTNSTDQDISLSVVNDGPDPVTVLGGTISSLDFAATRLTPADATTTAPGSVSTLRARAHFVCGDFPDRQATVATLRARTADGTLHQETLEVDRFSQVAEQSICARMPTPQIIRSTTFALTPQTPPPHTMGVPNVPTIYIAHITASNRAPFPLRMSLPQTAIESWGGAGLELVASGDTVIPPKGTGSIAISVSVTDCPNAIAAAQGFSYDLLSFSDARDSATDPQVRSFDQSVPIADQNVIMSYCLAHGLDDGSVVGR